MSENEDDWYALEEKGVWIQREMNDCNTSCVKKKPTLSHARTGEPPATC
jgi:hypothetical protein